MIKKTIILSRNMSIGNVSAENDEDFLFNCYVDHPARIAVKDVRNSKSFLLGSTGSGKTAIIKKISRDCDYASVLELNDLSMSYISNSNVIRFIQEMGVSLDYFFQALWRHIIIVEYIRIAFDITLPEKSKNLFERLVDGFGRNEAKKKSNKIFRELGR